MNLLKQILYKKTDYVGGDIPGRGAVDLSKSITLSLPSRYTSPEKLDFQSLCLPASNQGSNPACAGFSTAGYLEVQNWRVNHIQEQLDGLAIYRTAKTLDNSKSDGTTLPFAAEAAIKMGLVSGTPNLIKNDRRSIKFAVHQYSVVVAGFAITDEWNMVHRRTGIIARKSRPRELGGHAVLVCGYDQYHVYIQNSWGPSWGFRGFGKLSWPQFDQQMMYGLVIALESNA